MTVAICQKRDAEASAPEKKTDISQGNVTKGPVPNIFWKKNASVWLRERDDAMISGWAPTGSGHRVLELCHHLFSMLTMQLKATACQKPYRFSTISTGGVSLSAKCCSISSSPAFSSDSLPAELLSLNDPERPLLKTELVIAVTLPLDISFLKSERRFSHSGVTSF
jgi:hypothetical protein